MCLLLYRLQDNLEHTPLQPSEWDYMSQILPTEELGVGEGSMYDRLISIFEGDDIPPENYDLLLQLDISKARTTLDNTKISQYRTLLIGYDGVNDYVDSNGDENHKKIL